MEDEVIGTEEALQEALLILGEQQVIERIRAKRAALGDLSVVPSQEEINNAEEA